MYFLAVTQTTKHGDVAAQWRDTTRQGKHIADAMICCFQREASGSVHLPEYGHLIAAYLHRQDAHLRLLHEATFTQQRGDTPITLAIRSRFL